MPDARPHQKGGLHRAQGAAADQRHTRIHQPRLPLRSDLLEQDLARVARRDVRLVLHVCTHQQKTSSRRRRRGSVERLLRLPSLICRGSEAPPELAPAIPYRDRLPWDHRACPSPTLDKMEELDCDFSARSPSSMKPPENYHACGGLSTSVARSESRRSSFVAHRGSVLSEVGPCRLTVRPVGQSAIVPDSLARAALFSESCRRTLFRSIMWLS